MCRHQRKIRSHYVQILSHIFLCAVLLVTASGCANNQAEHPARRVFAVEIPEVSVRSVKDDVDAVCGVLPVENGVIIVGKKGSHLSAVIQDQDGQTVSETLLQEQTDTAEVLCVSSNHLGGVSVLFRETSDNSRIPSEHPAFIVHFQPDGTAVKTISLSETAFMPVGLCVLPDGTSVLSDTSRLLVCDPQGNMMEYGRPEGTEILSVATAGDQCYVVSCHVGVLGVYPFDIQHGTYGDFVRCRGEVTPIIMFGGSLDGSIYVNTGDAIYEYNPEENAFTQRFLWDAVSVSGETIDYFAVSDHHTFTGVTIDDTNIYRVTTIIDETERKIIRIGAVVNQWGEQNSRLNRLVTLFNMEQREHYAQVIYYEDPAQLKLSMATNEAPDIVETTYLQMPVTPDKFVDLLPFFERESRISKDDLVPSVVNALTVDGSLTSIPFGFSIYTVLARSSYVGNDPGLKIEDVIKILDERGDEYTAFASWMTPEIVFGWATTFSLMQYVDYSHFDCDFNNEDYIRLLHFCSRAPKEFDIEKFDSEYQTTCLMAIEPIHQFVNFENVCRIYQSYNVESYTYIGFPGRGDGNGSTFASVFNGIVFAIPERSSNKEGAWELIQMMLSDSCQNRSPEDEGLPINRHVFESVLQDEISKPDAVITQKDAEKIMNLIDGTTGFIQLDNMICSIQAEEAAAFFAGQKSAEEVAEIIQSRVSLYLEEKK